MKKIMIILSNVVLLIFSALLYNIFLEKEGVGAYFKYFDLDSFLVDDLLPSVFIVLLLYSIYGVVSIFLLKENRVARGILTGILGCAFVYIAIRFFVGISYPGLTAPFVKSLLFILFMGILLPFSENWIRQFLNRIFRKRIQP